MSAPLRPLDGKRPWLILREIRSRAVVQQPFHHLLLAFPRGPAQRSGGPLRFDDIDVSTKLKANLGDLLLPLGRTAVQQGDAEPIAAVGIQPMLYRPARHLRSFWSGHAPPRRWIWTVFEDIRLVDEDEPPQ